MGIYRVIVIQDVQPCELTKELPIPSICIKTLVQPSTTISLGYTLEKRRWGRISFV